MGDHDEGDADYVGRWCKCGLEETDLAWAIGDRACPDCERVWPENLRTRAPHDGGPTMRAIPSVKGAQRLQTRYQDAAKEVRNLLGRKGSGCILAGCHKKVAYLVATCEEHGTLPVSPVRMPLREFELRGLLEKYARHHLECAIQQPTWGAPAKDCTCGLTDWFIDYDGMMTKALKGKEG